MELTEIKAKKRVGDYDIVSEMVGIGRDNVRKSLQRTDGKWHTRVVEAFTKLIQSREALLPKQKGN
jgi:hypothetical protein